MITKTKSVAVYVRDQAAAVDFWMNKAGFEKRADNPMGLEARWIELAAPGSDTVIVPFTPPGMEDRIGSFAGIVFDCDDIQATYETMRNKRVVFSEPPTMQPWGMMQAIFEDNEGNRYVLVQAG